MQHGTLRTWEYFHGLQVYCYRKNYRQFSMFEEKDLMRIIMLLLLLVFILPGRASSQTVVHKDKRIADTIKAVLLRSGLKKEQIDTFTITSIEQITDKEQTGAEIETATTNVYKANELLRYDSTTIKFAKIAINADSNALMKATSKSAQEKAGKKELMKDKSDLDKAYTTMRKDYASFLVVKKLQDSLMKLYPKADDVKKENYKVLTHVALTTPQGKINANALIYLDKKYKMVGMRQVTK